MTEQWKPIKENPEYQVSSYGRVLGKRGNIRKLCVKKDGRLAVIISVNGKQKEFLVHRLVAQAFIPNPITIQRYTTKTKIIKTIGLII